MHEPPKRVRVALAISAGFHLLVFGALAFVIVQVRFGSRHPQTVIQIDTSSPEPLSPPSPKPDEKPSNQTPLPAHVPVLTPPFPLPQLAALKQELPAPVEESLPSTPPLFNEAQALFTNATLVAPVSSPAPAEPSVPQAKEGGQSQPVGTPFPLAFARYRHNPQPVYPASARRLRQEGLVVLAVELDGKGRPTEVKIKTSSGYFLLDAAAQRAVLGWEFIPAQSAEQTVSSTVEVPILFKLTDAVK